MIWNFSASFISAENAHFVKMCVLLSIYSCLHQETLSHPSIHFPPPLLLHSWSHGCWSQPQLSMGEDMVHRDQILLNGVTPRLMINCSPETLWIGCSVWFPSELSLCDEKFQDRDTPCCLALQAPSVSYTSPHSLLIQKKIQPTQTKLVIFGSNLTELRF